jgi:predicted  nucleic acid-binding Zn-ribbon protein
MVLPDNVWQTDNRRQTMLETIENLLILQDRDRRIRKARAELANIDPQRQMFQAKLAHAQASLESSKLRLRQLETERKKLELDVDTKKQLIEKYSLQQFQTKKNEEYRALAHEIELCRADITKLDDQQLELMEQADHAQREVAAASHAAAELKREIANQTAQIAAREETLTKERAELESNRDQLAAAIEERVLLRYERLLEHKGENVVVGIDHGVCGGCHMRLSRQIVVSCQSEQDIVNCTNCGRILYYTREMNVAVAE